jgi:small subunit ribosomal protein S2
MRQISLRELLEAGCHFGHHVERWNPKAAEFIYGEKNGVHIINLEKTKAALEKTGEFLKKAAMEGKNIIFVATKKQAKSLMKDVATKHDLMFFVNRWPGGFLTNFDIVSKNFKVMTELEELIATAAQNKTRTKKELLLASRKLKKLETIYGTVRSLKKLPEVLVIVDIKKEQKVVWEAEKTGVTTVALVDTNADPNKVDFAIPTNDDAVGALKLMLEYLGEAVAEGKQLAEKVEPIVAKN